MIIRKYKKKSHKPHNLVSSQNLFLFSCLTYFNIYHINIMSMSKKFVVRIAHQL